MSKLAGMILPCLAAPQFRRRSVEASPPRRWWAGGIRPAGRVRRGSKRPRKITSPIGSLQKRDRCADNGPDRVAVPPGEAIDGCSAFDTDGVQSVVARYRGLVESAERAAIGMTAIHEHSPGKEENEGGCRLVGGPIELTFSRPLTDIDLFLDGLLSSREPFRLWGIANDVSDDYTEIEAVDLHVGQRIRIEVSSTMIRIFLRTGGCGNTIARLVSNLQHH